MLRESSQAVDSIRSDDGPDSARQVEPARRFERVRRWSHAVVPPRHALREEVFEQRQVQSERCIGHLKCEPRHSTVNVRANPARLTSGDRVADGVPPFARAPAHGTIVDET